MFGRPIGQNQGVQFPIARAHIHVEAVRESRSRPGLGVVTVRTTGLKQTGEVVIEFTRTLLVYKRGHGPRAEGS